MNKEIKFNFQPYTSAEADRFIEEYPISRIIRSWHNECGKQWDGSNPSEHWSTFSYEKTKGTPSGYYAIERRLWVVGGGDYEFLLAKIEGAGKVSDYNAQRMLLTLGDNQIHGQYDPITIDKLKGETLFRASIQSRTNKFGELVHFGDRWGKGSEFYYEQINKFIRGKA